MIHFVVHEDGDGVGVVVVEGVKAGQELTGWVMEDDKDIRIDSAGTSSSPSGDVVTIYPYSIPNLVQASRNGCLERMRLEQRGR